MLINAENLFNNIRVKNKNNNAENEKVILEKGINTNNINIKNT